jgi:hypothetical protein
VRLLLLVLTAGCGRFAFEPNPDASDGTVDAKPCAPVGHDEDGDSVDDACDVCPHLPDVQQPDADGDGVGDMCDPNPMAARERIAFFDPYTSMRSEWEYNNPALVTVVNDQLSGDARTGVITGALKPRGPTDDVYVMGGRVGAGVASGQRQVTAVLGGVGYYYCEINGNQTAVAFFNATYTPDDVNFFVAAGSDAVGPIENRTFRLELHSSPTMYGCATTWPATTQSFSASRPPITVDHFNFALQGLDVKLDYFIQIQSD